jgi:hypothetical protein
MTPPDQSEIQELIAVLRNTGNTAQAIADVAVLKATVAQLLQVSAESVKTVNQLCIAVAQLTTLQEQTSTKVNEIDTCGSKWVQVQMAGTMPDTVKHSDFRKNILIPLVVAVLCLILGALIAPYL